MLMDVFKYIKKNYYANILIKIKYEKFKAASKTK